DNVLQVPVQSVLTIGDHRYIFVIPEDGIPVRKTIKIGQASDTMIEILDGIEAGEEVILNPRTHFADELIDLEEQLALDKKEQESKQAPGQAGRKSPSSRNPGKPSAKSGKQPAGKKKTTGGATGFMKRFDKNSDGKVSKEEAPAALKERFSTIDSNKDGFLNAGELSKLKPPSGGGRPSGAKRP
ncbi:MAG: hypothetical protein K0U82_07585, partial [Planctomycetes bacterium]|nr:hypothetical protein [Planctomycetota bacterium]